jgi:hypothetical protein
MVGVEYDSAALKSAAVGKSAFHKVLPVLLSILRMYEGSLARVARKTCT